MPADASVRPARGADVPAIAAVQARAWQRAYTDLFTPQVASALTADRFEAAWQAEVGGDPAVFVATLGAEIVAVASARQSTAPGAPAELATLVVDPDHQRQGHGSRLLAAVVDTLREAGVATLTTWAPSVDDARLRFLRSAGLEPDGAQRRLENGAGEEIIEIRFSAAL
jgi:GNAT superfamily N-acetyltransferase